VHRHSEQVFRQKLWTNLWSHPDCTSTNQSLSLKETQIGPKVLHTGVKSSRDKNCRQTYDHIPNVLTKINLYLSRRLKLVLCTSHWRQVQPAPGQSWFLGRMSGGGMTVQPIADSLTQNLEILSKTLVNVPEFCPWDLRLVPGNNMAIVTDK